MIGETSHDTSENYMWRRDITRRFIEEKGFDFKAVAPLHIKLSGVQNP